ncbi:MAG: hypothetical protein IJQ65_08665, partial [Kiritimatiellae bacterium]|nr:hypothetical protein [Kiritimatiellia bacterium]
ALSEIDDSARIAANSIAVRSDLELDLILVSLSASGSSKGAAIGGTIGIVINNAKALVNMGNGAVLTSDGNIDVSTYIDEMMVDVLASASASGKGVGVSAVLSVLVTSSESAVTLGNVTMTAGGSVNVTADSKSTIVLVSAGLAASGKSAAAGATISVDVFSRTAKVVTGALNINAGGDVVISAYGKDMTVLIALALAGSSQGATVSGTIPVVVGGSTITTMIGSGSVIKARGSVGNLARYDTQLYDIAGGISVSGNGAAVGATISTIVMRNDVGADAGDNVTIVAQGALSGVSTPANRDLKRRGVVFSATSRETIIQIAIAASVSGSSAAISGVIDTLVVKNTVHARIGAGGRLYAGYALVGENPTASNVDGSGAAEIFVEADDDTLMVEVGGSLSVSGSTGVGATVLVMVFNKTVEADLGAIHTAMARADVTVRANNEDDLWLLGISFSAASNTAVAAGVNAMVFQSHTYAALGGNVTAENGTIDVSAKSDSFLLNVAACIAGSSSAGATAVVLVTYFYNSTKAVVTDNAKLTAKYAVNVAANSNEILSADGAGVAVGGSAGIGGTLDVVIMKLETKAYTGRNATLKSLASSVSVTAHDDYTLVAVIITATFGGSAAVGVSALVSLSFNTVEAKVGAQSVIDAYTDALVSASSDRNLVDVSASIAGGGEAGVGVSIGVVVAGALMSQDAHDAIYSGSGPNPQTQMDAAFASGNSNALAGQKPEDNMDDLLAGDGQKAEEFSSGYDEYGQDLYEHPEMTRDFDIFYTLDGDGNSVAQKGPLTFKKYRDGEGKFYYVHNLTATRDSDGNITGYYADSKGTFEGVFEYDEETGALTQTLEIDAGTLSIVLDTDDFTFYTKDGDTYRYQNKSGTVKDNDDKNYNTYTITDENGKQYDAYVKPLGGGAYRYVYVRDGVYYVRNDMGELVESTNTDDRYDLSRLYVRYRSDKQTDGDGNSADAAPVSDGGMNDGTLDQADNKNTYQAVGSYKDATSAVIDAAASVTSRTGGISVLSSDVLDTVVVGGTVAIGGAAGVGVGISVGV